MKLISTFKTLKIMEFFVFAIIFFAVFFIIVVNQEESKKAAQNLRDLKRIENFIPSGEITKPYSRLVQAFHNGETLENEEVKASLDECLSFVKGKDNKEADIIKAIMLNLSLRDVPRERTTNKFNLKSGESILGIGDCCLQTIQKLRRTISYSGIRSTVGGVRFGSTSYTANDIEGPNVFGVGKMFVTNKRLVFIDYDNVKNKIVPINKILSYAPYDRFGIIFVIENSTPILCDFNAQGIYNEETLCVDEGRIDVLFALDTLFNKN